MPSSELKSGHAKRRAAAIGIAAAQAAFVYLAIGGGSGAGRFNSGSISASRPTTR